MKNRVNVLSAVVASLLFCSASITANCQGTVPQIKDSLSVIALIGTWSNASNARIDFTPSTKGFDQAKDVALPGSTTSVPFIQLRASGELFDPRLTNANWRIVNYSSVVIKPEFGREFTAFISKNDSTQQYKLTILGETFVKNTIPKLHQLK